MIQTAKVKTSKEHYHYDGASAKNSKKAVLHFMLDQAGKRESKKDIRTRLHLMERSFARGTHYGYQSVRWCRLWRVEIQEYLTASIKNMMVLFRDIKKPKVAPAIAKAKSVTKSARYSIHQQFSYFKKGITDRMKYLFCKINGLNYKLDFSHLSKHGFGQQPVKL